MGTASCSQKTCPAYSKSNNQAPTQYAKQMPAAKTDASRI